MLYMVWLIVTVIPFALMVILLRVLGLRGNAVYWSACYWLKMSVSGARLIVGIRYQVSGMENLPYHSNDGVILLVKHQSAYETLLMPAIMPRPLAFVFKKELLYIPFFGWAMACLDMIHINREHKTQAFQRVVEQGRALLNKGIWVIMFPEGTRIPRGQRGKYKSGGARLAVESAANVIPVAVASAKCWPKNSFLKYPGLVSVSIGPAIKSAGLTTELLNSKVEDWIESEMRRIDPSAYSGLQD
jgi:1-acyl-sn-glycerol-3-phosphate acyltransferase